MLRTSILLFLSIFLSSIGAATPENDPFQGSQDILQKIDPTTGSELNQPWLPGNILWRWVVIGRETGRDVLDSADLTGNGRKEIIATGTMSSLGSGAHSHSLIVFDENLDRAVCVLDLPPLTVFDHYLFSPGNGQPLDILLATNTGLFQLDGRSCRIKHVQPLPGFVEALALGDVNGNGIPDVAYSIAGDLYLAPWNDFSQPLERRGFGGSRIIVDSLGRPGGDDVAVVSDVLYVLRGDSLETITEIAAPSMDHVAMGDVTGDGIGNIVLGATWYDGITLYDLFDNEPLFTHPVFNLAVIRLQDVTGDGAREIVYGEAQWGDVHVLDGQGEIKHTVNNPNHGISNVLASDLSGNGQMEMFWGRQQLLRADLESGQISWRSVDLNSPFQFSLLGQDRVFVTASKPTNSSNMELIRVINAHTGEAVTAFPTGVDWSNEVQAIATGTIGPDNQPAYCAAITGPSWNYMTVACYDADTGSLLWSRNPEIGSVPLLKLADFDGNGQPDLLVLGTLGFIRLHDAATGHLKWQSEELWNSPEFLTPGFRDLALIEQEIWLILPGGHLRRINPINGDTIFSLDNAPLRHIARADNTLYGVRAGEGVGVVNLQTLAFDQLIHASDEELSVLTASSDGRLLLTGSGERPELHLRILSTADEFPPWEVGGIMNWRQEFADNNDLFLATNNGVMRIRTNRLWTLFQDRFQH